MNFQSVDRGAVLLQGRRHLRAYKCADGNCTGWQGAGLAIVAVFQRTRRMTEHPKCCRAPDNRSFRLSLICTVAYLTRHSRSKSRVRQLCDPRTVGTPRSSAADEGACCKDRRHSRKNSHGSMGALERNWRPERMATDGLVQGSRTETPKISKGRMIQPRPYGEVQFFENGLDCLYRLSNYGVARVKALRASTFGAVWRAKTR